MIWESFDRRASGTEEWMMWTWSHWVEAYDWEGVKKWLWFLSITERKEKEVYDNLIEWNAVSDVEALHFHPVLHGQVNLHPSPEDLKTRKHQKDTFWIDYQWIVWFDKEPPYTMRRVKYKRDGTMVIHKVWWTAVKVSRIQRDWTWDGWMHDLDVENTRNLQLLEEQDKKKEIHQLVEML